MDKKIKNDPENYHKLSEPFDSLNESNDAIGKFFEELSELRKKYELRDVLVVVYDSAKTDDGIGEFLSSSQMGSSTNALSMAAYVYGQQQAEQREKMSRLLSGKT